MIDRSLIREHMDVIAADGSRVGAVDAIETDRIKLTRKDSPDGQHHYVDLDDVERVDKHVHLLVGRKAVLGSAAAAGAAAVGSTKDGPSSSRGKDSAPSPLIKNPLVPDAKPRRNFMLPWVILGLAILGLLALALSGQRGGEDLRRDAIARDAAAQSGGGAVQTNDAAEVQP